MQFEPIGVFDSGIGGLGVLTQCLGALPDESFVYLADEKNMPYGQKSEAEIRNAALAAADFLAKKGCKAIVVACNTATEVAIDDIRRKYPALITVGLEPAVRPCCRELGRGYAVALVTEATARSEKFKNLVSVCDGRVKVAPQNDLARLVEMHKADLELLRKPVSDVLRPYSDAESVILGCSHYTYLRGLVREFYGERIKIYDGAEGAAARLNYLLALKKKKAPKGQKGKVEYFSSLNFA